MSALAVSWRSRTWPRGRKSAAGVLPGATADHRQGRECRVWEFSLGAWLVVKGFKPSPITTGMTAAGTAPAYHDVTA